MVSSFSISGLKISSRSMEQLARGLKPCWVAYRLVLESIVFDVEDQTGFDPILLALALYLVSPVGTSLCSAFELWKLRRTG
jgi:hypothetical protein